MPQGEPRDSAFGVPKRGSTFRDPLFEAPEYLALQERLRENLRRIRQERGWTQAEAAKRCGRMSYQHFAQLESGRTNVTLVTLCRIAGGLGVDVVELLGPHLGEATAEPVTPVDPPCETPVKETIDEVQSKIDAAPEGS